MKIRLKNTKIQNSSQLAIKINPANKSKEDQSEKSIQTAF